jgi:hypothetical protein
MRRVEASSHLAHRSYRRKLEGPTIGHNSWQRSDRRAVGAPSRAYNCSTWDYLRRKFYAQRESLEKIFATRVIAPGGMICG